MILRHVLAFALLLLMLGCDSPKAGDSLPPEETAEIQPQYTRLPNGESPCPRNPQSRLHTPARVVQEVYTNPREAKLTLDGKPVENPLRLEYPSGELHSVEASLPGFVTKKSGLARNFSHCLYLELITVEEDRDRKERRAAAKKREVVRQAEREKRAAKMEQVARECFSQYSPRQLKGAALRKRWDEVRGCFAKSGTDDLVMQVPVTKVPFAWYGREKHDVFARYSCSDMCPTYGGLRPSMDLSADDCPRAGGVPIFDPAWGGYRGCVPLELASDYEKKKAEQWAVKNSN